MRISISIVFIFLFFQACSFKSPQNQWEYNSSSSFNSYMKNFLTDNEELAKDDLQRAIKYAKQSANLEQLSRIYLGECSLNISVGKKKTCEKYLEIREFISSLELKAYFNMLQNKLEKKQIKNLPIQYQEFSKFKSEKKYFLAFESIKQMKQVSSKFIAASLIKNYLEKSHMEYLIKEASFYGYKKSVLFWLVQLKEIETNINDKKRIEKKIRILKN